MTGSEFDKVDSFIESAFERLHAASLMLENGHYIDSVNRSYYAMANMAMAALTLKEIQTKTHKGLHVRFHEIFIKSELIDIAYGKDLNKVEMIRGKCDYTPSTKISEELAEDIFQKAEKFILEVHRVIEKARS